MPEKRVDLISVAGLGELTVSQEWNQSGICINPAEPNGFSMELTISGGNAGTTARVQPSFFQNGGMTTLPTLDITLDGSGAGSQNWSLCTAAQMIDFAKPDIDLAI